MTGESDGENLRINFMSGTGFLREDYKNKRETRYYLVLSGRLLAGGVDSRLPAPELKEVAIPISEKQYTDLQTRLQGNHSQSPVIRIKGSLDVTIDRESFA
jgi:hypothetical protein